MGDSGPQDVRIQLAKIDARYRTFRTGLRMGGGVLIAFFAFKAIEALAGRATSVSVFLRLILDALIDLKFALTITLAGACAAWAVAERILRQRAVGRLGARNAELERRLDPNRTTSGLTMNGKTHPRDRAR